MAYWPDQPASLTARKRTTQKDQTQVFLALVEDIKGIRTGRDFISVSRLNKSAGMVEGVAQLTFSKFVPGHDKTVFESRLEIRAVL